MIETRADTQILIFMHRDFKLKKYLDPLQKKCILMTYKSDIFTMLRNRL